MIRNKINILVVGNIDVFKDKLLRLTNELNVSISFLKSFRGVARLVREFTFDIILVDLHLDQNYDGLTIEIDKNSYKKFYLMTNEVEKITLINRFNKNAEYFLIPKNFKEIRTILVEHFLLKFQLEPTMIPVPVGS